MGLGVPRQRKSKLWMRLEPRHFSAGARQVKNWHLMILHLLQRELAGAPPKLELFESILLSYAAGRVST